MTRKRTLPGSKLALATLVATGMAAAPVALGPGLFPQPQDAAAQTGDPGVASPADDDAQEYSGSAVTPRLTTMRETTASLSGNMNSLTVSSRQFEAYKWAMRRGNLDLASTALADAADRPVTAQMVNEVNNELGVDSTLTSVDVAEAARAKQKHSY